jgi:ABC-type ATPase with predicted acetyltransferase domain
MESEEMISSARVRTVARWFGLSHSTDSFHDPEVDIDAILPAPGQITLVTGASGAGKSSLLRAIRPRAVLTLRWIDLNEVSLPDRALVDCFGEGIGLDGILRLLARVGLSEARTMLRTPSQLSDGQRWRLRLALGVHHAALSVHRPCTELQVILVADEFAALLDRVTASVVAHALRQIVKPPLRAIVATSHDDLLEALSPDVHVYCDFGSIRITRRGVNAA